MPGDYNSDGRTDFLVYYWGRSPIVFLARSTATKPSPAAYRPVDLLPGASLGGQYSGPDWNTNAAAVADFDGTGHPDLFVGNYFPDSAVLDPNGIDNVQMPASLSNAKNGGGDHVFRWKGGTPGHIKFSVAIGERTPTTPKSFVVGKGSFKGMGVDFGDLSGNGKFDFMVSNITTAWGLEESNFVFMNNASSGQQMQQDLAGGYAPFTQNAAQLGMAECPHPVAFWLGAAACAAGVSSGWC